MNTKENRVCDILSCQRQAVLEWHHSTGVAYYCYEHQVEMQMATIRQPQPAVHDPVNHPKHYTKHPSGVECITVTEHFNFCLGNAIKYIWRAGEKGDALEDLRKAKWYLEREIERRGKTSN